MAMSLLPFQANIPTANGVPYLLRLSQGFNEAIFYGSGQPQTPELASAIERMMKAVQGQADPVDAPEAFVTRLMALTYHLEYLVTALTGNQLELSDHQAFLDSLQQLAGELTHLKSGSDQLSQWVRQRLQDAQFRHFQRHGLPARQTASMPVPVQEEPGQRPQLSFWTGEPHWSSPLLSSDVPVLN